MTDLREVVADAMWDELRFAQDRQDFEDAATVVCAAVIETLAAAADAAGDYGLSFCSVCDCGGRASDWLRAHIDAGRAGEAGR